MPRHKREEQKLAEKLAREGQLHTDAAAETFDGERHAAIQRGEGGWTSIATGTGIMSSERVWADSSTQIQAAVLHWEHTSCWLPDFDFDRRSSEMGRDGWELVAVIGRPGQARLADGSLSMTSGCLCYFKKMVIDPSRSSSSSINLDCAAAAAAGGL